METAIRAVTMTAWCSTGCSFGTGWGTGSTTGRTGATCVEARNTERPDPLRQAGRSVENAESGQRRVEAESVLHEDLALRLVGEVAALLDQRGRLRIRHVPVRVVGGVHDAVRAHEIQHRAHHLLVGLARVVDATGGQVLAGPRPEMRRLAGSLLELLVHALHPVGQPAAADLEEAEREVGEALGDALEDHRR